MLEILESTASMYNDAYDASEIDNTSEILLSLYYQW